MSNDFIDSLMGFDPQNLDAFKEKQSNNYDANIYKTNPVKLAKSDDGIYRSRIKVIYNPKNLQKSIVHRATYGLTDQNGFFLVKSKLGNGIVEGRSCPIFQAWKKLWFSKDPADKEWAKEKFEKNESDWVIIQVLEDVNQPELVGKFLYWKLPNTINLKMKDKMNPSPESKKQPVPIMDYLIGNALELVVKPGPDDPSAPQRKQREITYELSEFEAESSPIIKTDGTSLFADEELETIDSYVMAKNDAIKAKTETRRTQALQTIQDLTPDMKNLYRKAMQYLDENMKLDLENNCGYQPWDEALTKRVQDWIDTVLAHQDPATTNVNENNPLTNPTPKAEAEAPAKETFTAEVPQVPSEMDMMSQVMKETPSSDLPF